MTEKMLYQDEGLHIESHAKFFNHVKILLDDYELTKTEWVTILLRDYHDFSFREIGAILKISHPTAIKIHETAKSKLLIAKNKMMCKYK